MKAITLHTSGTRLRGAKLEKGVLTGGTPEFADAGTTLTIGVDVSGEDAAALVERGAAVEADAKPAADQ